MTYHPQQTVKLAIDCLSGEMIQAETLLQIDEAEFSGMRRSAMSARVERKRGGNTVRFLCAICRQALFLSRRKEGNANRWFVHDGKSEECPWYEGNKLTPEQTKALIYRGQQEGAKHQEYKNFLAHWLSKDSHVSKISQEQTTFSEVVKGEWRRPDVKCLYKGKPLVFEVQLSYTFLSDVIARDEFYKREKIFIVWVFSKFELNRAAVTDEAFFNRRNVFVLDDEALKETTDQGVLTFSGYRQLPKLINKNIYDTWESGFVSLGYVTFPTDTFRPYFYNYEAEKTALLALQSKELQRIQLQTWQQSVDEFIDLAIDHYESDCDDDTKNALLSKVDRLKDSSYWREEFKALKEYEFNGWHGVLSVLLSIKLNRPISYSKDFTVYQVIEAGLRTSYKDFGKHANAILYLWACKTYKPTMTTKNHSWISTYAKKVKSSIDNNENIYRRFTGYDEIIKLLFPELRKHLATTFGT